MPLYEMHCTSCGLTHDIRKKMAEPLPNSCPKCSSKNYSQNYASLGNAVFLDNVDPKSAGHQAELNTKKRGHYKNSEELAKRAKPKVKPSWWQEGAPDISKIKDTQKYIITGETS